MSSAIKCFSADAMIGSISHPGCLASTVSLWLLLLAALPVTAPFSTLDLAPVGLAATVLDSGKTKTSHDDVIAAPASGVIVLTADDHATRVTGTARPHQSRHAQHMVLRL